MIGKRGYINVNGWIVALEVTDVKKVFGHEKLECTQPLSNVRQWINRESFIEVAS